jgi:hypothetical protein
VAFLRGCLQDFVCEALHHGGIAQDVELRVGRFGADCPHDMRAAATPVSAHPAPVFCVLVASAQRAPTASQDGEHSRPTETQQAVFVQQAGLCVRLDIVAGDGDR